MRVQLINAPAGTGQDTSGFEFLYPPLGLLYLASYGRKAVGGWINFRFSDGLISGMESTLDEVRSFRPDVVGISFTTSAAEGAYEMIAKIKKISKDIFVVSGGPHPTALPEEVMTRSEADVCVIGEGEAAFAEILSGMNPREIAGVTYRDGGPFVRNPVRKPIEDLDSIPFPARDLIKDRSVYKGYYLSKGKPEMTIVSSRGCPYQCVFCSNPVWKAQRPYFRARSPENVVAELRELKERFGVREIFDETDDFNISKTHAMKLSQAVAEANLGLHFKFQVRANTMDGELAENLKKMGAWLVFVGAESGNQRTLDGVKKRIRVEDIENCSRELSERGIKVYGLFMGFNVWEEGRKLCFEGVGESRETIRFAKSLLEKGYMHFMGFSLTNPFPASELFDICVRHGLIDRSEGWRRWNDLWRLNLRVPGVSERDWEAVKAEAAKAQALAALKSGRVNLRTMYPLMRRGIRLIKLELKNRLLGRTSAA